MKRIAILGATGSIGRQALEVCDANPELEVCALASGASPLDALGADYPEAEIQVGGELAGLLDRTRPDVVLNAVTGFAGLPVTMWALERGVTLALANKESLVAAGELALAAWERGGGLLLPVDSEHSAIFQCLRGEQAEGIVLTASGGPFRGRTRDELAHVTAEQALAHPTWSMGPKITIDSATLANKGLELIEAHFLFGLDFDRIEVVVHPTSIVHGIVRLRDGAALAHIGYPDMRVPISFALSYPDRAPTPVPPLELDHARVRGAGSGDVPAAPAGPRGRRARRHVPLCVQRGERGRGRRLPRRAARLPRHSRLRRVGAGRVGPGARRRPGGARRRRRGGPEAGPAARMNAIISIFGLALLILIHEAGHFFTARAVGMRPRKFYLGFPPALAKVNRNGIEYGVGAIPLGGYVKIPGMHRPAGSDLEVYLGRAVHEAPELAAPLARVQRELEQEDFEAARAELPQLEQQLEAAELSPPARARAERGLREVEDALAPDAYWRASSWKRVAVIFAGPGTNILFALALFAAVFMLGTTRATPTIESVLPDRPAAAAGLKAGDRIVAINGSPVSANEISRTIAGSGGKPLRIVVVRDGRRVALQPVRAKEDAGTYRIGIALRGVPGPGKSLPAAVGSSVRLTGDVTKEIGRSLLQLGSGKGRDQISSPVGIVRGSSAALKRSAQDYLAVLGLISLSLALLNLLPLLPLDGGHIAFSIIEGVRRRAVPRAVYERVSAFGIVLVLLLFLLGLNNDLGG